MRMSGAPSWASTEPSTYSTIEWITDCGWTTTSNAVGLEREQVIGLDQLEPLVHQGRRIDRDLGAHRPIGMRHRLRRGDRAHLVAARAPERPAAGGQDDRGAPLAAARGRSTGRSHCARNRPAAGVAPLAAAALRSSASPAETSASLLASATVPPPLERRHRRLAARRCRRSPPSSSRRPSRPRRSTACSPAAASIPVPASASRRASRQAGVGRSPRASRPNPPRGVGEPGDIALRGQRDARRTGRDCARSGRASSGRPSRSRRGW